jgi:hypothetical protein
MMDSSERMPNELQLLQDTISRSPIFFRQVSLAERLADWQRTRVAPDVDAVVLAWIRSHVTRRPRQSLF